MKGTILALGGILALYATLAISGLPESEPERLTPRQEIKLRRDGEEIISLRRRNVYVVKQQENTLKANIYQKPLFYFDGSDSTYKTPDLSVKRISALERLNPFRSRDSYVSAGPYKAEWRDDKPHDYHIERDGVSLSYEALFDMNAITVETVPVVDGVKQNYILADATAATNLRWLIDTNAVMQSADVNADIVFDYEGEFAFMVTAPIAWDAAGQNVIVNSWVDGDTLSYDVQLPETVSWPVTVDPSTTIRMVNVTASVTNTNASWAVARNATSGSVVENQLAVGQKTNNVSRSFLTFEIPEIGIALAGSLLVNGLTNNSTTQFFDLYLLDASSHNTVPTVADYNNFDGWAASGAYTGTVLNDTWNSASFSSGANNIALNSSGLDLITAASGDSLKIALISSNDYNNTGFTADEWLAFWWRVNESLSPRLTFTYAVLPPNAPTDFTKTAASTSSLSFSWADNSSDEDGFFIKNAGGDTLTVGTYAANATMGEVSGLGVNTQYGLAVHSYNLDGISAPSDSVAAYTLANTPSTLMLTEAGATEFTMTFNGGSNPNETVYAVRDSTQQKWFDADGAVSDTKTWRTEAAWEALTFEREINTVCIVGVVGRNGDDVETAYIFDRLDLPTITTATVEAGPTGGVDSFSNTYSIARSGAGINTTHQRTWVGQDTQYYVRRGFYGFDTSFIPDDATIVSAEIVDTISTVGNTDFWFTFVNSWQGSSIATDDFIRIGSTAYSDSAWSADFTDSLKVSLKNPDTIISKSSITYMGIRGNDDINNIPPTGQEYWYLGLDTAYLNIEYALPPMMKPTDFALDSTSAGTIRAQFTGNHSALADSVMILDADSLWVQTLSSVTDTETIISGLAENEMFHFMAAVDSAGARVYSNPDSAYTLISAPQHEGITIIPVSSDSLKISAPAPMNDGLGSTALEIDAVSGSGASGSGWLTGTYSYKDGGLDPYTTCIYRMRYRNAEAALGSWSDSFVYVMAGLDTLIIPLDGDLFDDYSIDSGSGRQDSTVVRAGTSSAGEALDAFLSFNLPRELTKGGIDSVFLTMNRLDESAATSPSLTVSGLAYDDIDSVETLDLSGLIDSGVTTSWTISSGAGEKQSPNLRELVIAWRESAERQDYGYGFGLRIDDNSQPSGTFAAFSDASHPSYAGDSYLTAYFMPAHPDTLIGAPDILSLTTLGPDSLRADWNDGTLGEYGFVLVNLADSSDVAEADTAAADATSLTVGGLTPNTVHDWRIKAITLYDTALSASSSSARTLARSPGAPSVTMVNDSMLRFILNPLDNPGITKFALRDSLTGLFIDGEAEPDTLRPGPLGDWGWQTYLEWGGALGDTLTALAPDSLYVIQGKAMDQ